MLAPLGVNFIVVLMQVFGDTSEPQQREVTPFFLPTSHKQFKYLKNYEEVFSICFIIDVYG